MSAHDYARHLLNALGFRETGRDAELYARVAAESASRAHAAREHDAARASHECGAVSAHNSSAAYTARGCEAARASQERSIAAARNSSDARTSHAHNAMHTSRAHAAREHDAARARRENLDACAALDWARSGALGLTGYAEGPPVLPSAPLATVAAGAAHALAAFAPAHAGLDGAGLLGERAALQPGLARRGRSSASGAARLLRARDGFVAVNLPRGAEDLRLLPAWLACALPECASGAEDVAREGEGVREEIWDALARALAPRAVREVVARARLLGLTVAPCARATQLQNRARSGAQYAATHTRAVQAFDSPSRRTHLDAAHPATHAQTAQTFDSQAHFGAAHPAAQTLDPHTHHAHAPSARTRFTGVAWRARAGRSARAHAAPRVPWLVIEHAGARATRAAPPRVLDLSALWAGPLAGGLLAHAGARVVKVESARRPDAARHGSPALFALLNGAKEQRVLDFDAPAGRTALAREFRAADVVLEASRPRALRQLGFDARAWLAARPGRVWCALSGYGRDAPGDAWAALGDDAAAAAGLCHCAHAEAAPLFVGDAIADPLAGVHAALAVHASLRRGGGELLDLRLVGVVAHAIAQRALAPVRGRVVATRAGFAVQSGGQSDGESEPVAAPRARTVS